MNVTGIIAEYNPFHRGHKYQINYCKKELQADYLQGYFFGKPCES